MKLILNENNAVIACVFVGKPILSGSEVAVEVEEIPEKVRNADSGYYVYKDGEYSLNPDYAEPEPEPTLEETVAEQEQQIATLTECILEMSEYVYK